MTRQEIIASISSFIDDRDNLVINDFEDVYSIKIMMSTGKLLIIRKWTDMEPDLFTVCVMEDRTRVFHDFLSYEDVILLLTAFKETNLF